MSLVGAFLLWQALPAIADDKVNFLTSREWSVDNASDLRFGIVELLWTTIAVSIDRHAHRGAGGRRRGAVHHAVRAGLAERPAANLVDLLAAVPSIVYGIWGLKTFVPVFDPVQSFLKDTLGWFPLFSDAGISGGSTILMVGIVLAIMVLPIVTALSREVFAQTPVTHTEGALALGATKWEMIRVAVLPFGKAGVISRRHAGPGPRPRRDHRRHDHPVDARGRQ